MPKASEIADWQEMPVGGETPDDPGDWVDLPSAGQDRTSIAGSSVAGFGQGASFGFGDELAGLVGSKIVDPIASKFIDGYKPDTYDEARDFARGVNAKARDDNPWAYGLSEMAGGVTSAAPLGGGQVLGKTLPNVFGAFGKGGAAIGKMAGFGRAGQAVLRGASASAPIGAVYGAGSSEDGTAEGAIKGAAIAGLTGGALSGAGSLAAQGKESISKFGNQVGNVLDKFADDLTKAGGSQNTKPVEKAIAKQVLKLERSQAIPEARILKELAQNPGTPEGVSIRQRALMSPLSRAEKVTKFLDDTRGVYEKTNAAFDDFERTIRFKEAATNLAQVPAEIPKQAAFTNLAKARVMIGEMRKKSNRRMYDQATVGYLDAFTKNLANDVGKAQSSFEVYQAVNQAKKNVASLAKYGREVGPLERGTIDRVTAIEKSLTDMLENTDIFGRQAQRHREINAAYKAYLSGLQNMEAKFAANEAGGAGRPVSEINSTKFGTYARQLDTDQGTDRIRFFDDMLKGARGLSGVIDDSAKVTKDVPFKSVTGEIDDFMGRKAAFEQDYTLSNQLRRLRLDEMVQRGANPGPVQVAGETLAGHVLPGFDKFAGAMRSISKAGVSEQQRSNELLRELLLRETQRSAVNQATREAFAYPIKSISQRLKTHPQDFGKFAPMLQQAEQRSPSSLAATQHVLIQTNPEFREIYRQINGQEQPNQ